MSDWLTVRQYATKYAISPKTVHKWKQAGYLDFYVVGRCLRVENRSPKAFVRQSMSTSISHPPKP